MSVAHGSARSVETVLLAVAAAVTAALGLTAWAACRSSRRAEQSGPPRRRPMDRTGNPENEERPNLSVVMPCHNGGRALREMLQETIDVLSGTPPWEIVLVSDGSTDDTDEIARGFADRGVRLIAYPDRRGKGAALRIGLAAARGNTWPSSTRTATSSPRRSRRSFDWSTCTNRTRSSGRSDIRCRTSITRPSGDCSPGSSIS